MKLFEAKLKELYDVNENWIQIINHYINEDDSSNEKIKVITELFSELLVYGKAEYKKDAEALIKLTEKAAGHEDGKWLIGMIQGTLRMYLATAALRYMQKKNEEKAKMVLQYLFDNVILRFDPQFSEKYKSFGFEKEDEFEELAHMLDSITQYYTRRHFTNKVIKEDFMNETELNESICEYFAGLIERNYLSLQLNCLIDESGK